MTYMDTPKKQLFKDVANPENLSIALQRDMDRIQEIWNNPLHNWIWN